MMRALWSASTGMKGQETNIAVVSNNLSNVTTTGFKKSRVDFQDLMYQTLTEPGAPISSDNTYPVGIQLGHGERSTTTIVGGSGQYLHASGTLIVEASEDRSLWTKTLEIWLD